MVSDPRDWALLLSSLRTGWSWNGPSEEKTKAPGPSLVQDVWGGQHSFHRTLGDADDSILEVPQLFILRQLLSFNVASVHKLEP